MTTASAATATAETSVASTIRPIAPCPISAAPLGVSTKANGTRNAGSVYFQVASIVLNASPPVMAAEATAASAVGGLTSASTE